MGNDVADLDAMSIVGLPACPNDAHDLVVAYCLGNGFISKYDGGNGAFRDLVDILTTV